LTAEKKAIAAVVIAYPWTAVTQRGNPCPHRRSGLMTAPSMNE
jgi:hypothetical protein